MNRAFHHRCLRALILVLLFQCVYVSIEIVDEIRPHDARVSTATRLYSGAGIDPAANTQVVAIPQALAAHDHGAQDLVNSVCVDDHEVTSHEAGAGTCDHCCHCHGHGSHLAVLVKDITPSLAGEPARAVRPAVHFTSAPSKGIYRPPIA